MEAHIVDMNSYKRKAHFDYFRSLPYPYTGVTIDVDVTAALRYSKEHHCSFYLTMLHAAALAADAVPEFRQRIRGDQIIEYAECPTSHTERTKEGTYCYCTLHHHMNLPDYFAHAKEARSSCGARGITEDAAVESLYFCSTLPWLHYTSLIQPVACGDDSNPRITWGKYEVSDAGRVMMPMSVLVHHALVDGSHIAQFYDHLKQQIEALYYDSAFPSERARNLSS